MEINCPNQYINQILQPQNRYIISSRIQLKSPRQTIEQTPCLIDKKTGQSYYEFTWEQGFDRSLELMVSPDTYYPGKEKNVIFHSHNYFEIIYVYSGSCVSIISQKEVRMNSGDICLFNLQSVHCLRIFHPEDTVFNIVVRKDLLQSSFLDLLSENDFITSFFVNSIYHIKNPGDYLLIKPQQGYQCERLAQQIVEVYYKNEAMSQSIMKALLVLLLVELTRQARDNAIAQSKNPSTGMDITQVISYMNNNFEIVSLESLAEHFGYTTRTMSRFFKQVANSSFREILSDIKFNQACTYLREGNLSIEQISQIIGYSERSSFDKAFKKRYQLSAKEYRNQNCKIL